MAQTQGKAIVATGQILPGMHGWHKHKAKPSLQRDKFFQVCMDGTNTRQSHRCNGTNSSRYAWMAQTQGTAIVATGQILPGMHGWHKHKAQPSLQRDKFFQVCMDGTNT